MLRCPLLAWRRAPLWPPLAAISHSATCLNLFSKRGLGAHSLLWQWGWHRCQLPLRARDSPLGCTPAAKNAPCGCGDVKQAVVCQIENEGVRSSCQAVVCPGSWQAALERELHLTSFFLFLTLGILPSFIFLAFFFFCGLRESVSEKRLSRGARGTVLRWASSSSSGKKKKQRCHLHRSTQHHCSHTSQRMQKLTAILVSLNNTTCTTKYKVHWRTTFGLIVGWSSLC